MMDDSTPPAPVRNDAGRRWKYDSWGALGSGRMGMRIPFHPLIWQPTSMKPTVYIETSVISYLTAQMSRDLVVAAHQQLTAGHLHA